MKTLATHKEQQTDDHWIPCKGWTFCVLGHLLPSVSRIGFLVLQEVMWCKGRSYRQHTHYQVGVPFVTRTPCCCTFHRDKDSATLKKRLPTTRRRLRTLFNLIDPDKCWGPIVTFKKSDNGLPGPPVHEFARPIWLKTQCHREVAALFFTLGTTF